MVVVARASRLAVIGWPFYRARNLHPRWTWPWYRQHARKYGVSCCLVSGIITLVGILLMYAFTTLANLESLCFFT
jgi:hypothetical protein